MLCWSSGCGTTLVGDPHDDEDFDMGAPLDTDTDTDVDRADDWKEDFQQVTC